MALISVLESDVDNKTIVKKFGDCDFNCKSQLIVQQSQEAIFYYEGVPQDVFGPGRYTLDTSNIPILNTIIKKVTNDMSPFHAVVYFINTTEQLGIKWGTPDPFIMYEKIGENRQPFKVSARGEMSIRVNNSRKLIEKIVGTEPILLQESFIDKVFDLVITEVKDCFSKILSKDEYELYSLDQHLKDLSKEAFPFVNEMLNSYGVELGVFNVSNIKLPEDDPQFQQYTKMKSTATLFGGQDIDIELQRREALKSAEFEAIAASGRNARRQIEGYNYQQERGYDVAMAVAQNEGVGQYTNMGVGLGMMAGVGGALGDQVRNATNQAMYASQFGNPMMQGNPAMAGMQGQQSVNPMMAGMQGQQVVNPMMAGMQGQQVVNPMMQGGQAQNAETASDNTVECPECHKIIPKGKFCMECGYKFTEAKPVCKNCGNELLPGAKFCMECGTPV